MSAEARRNGWRGFDGIGEKVERSGYGHEPKKSGWLYRCDGMPSLRGCGEELIITRRLARVGMKSSGWYVCYGLESKPGTPGRFDHPEDWEIDEDIVLTFCPECTKVVLGQEAARNAGPT